MQSSTLARLGLSFLFIYQGLVPKLIFLDKTELYINQQHLELLPIQNLLTPELMAQLAGISEILLGILILIFPRKNWPVWLAFIALALLLLDIMVLVPELLSGAFNPVISNIVGMLLAWIALKTKTDPWHIKLT
ncbi:DoxX-like family protein [Alkanindiges illinoisensis]|uniref:DoxX-like family protein n=1 Tax=Alkanindiges illinoisensis TaxID=197183 RepID=UPI00047E9A44|nr:DoxX-like family protein [Alkanindiges illinoisensis]